MEREEITPAETSSHTEQYASESTQTGHVESAPELGVLNHIEGNYEPENTFRKI